MKWRIEWAGVELTDDTASAAHMALVTMIEGPESWKALDPFNGPSYLLAHLVAIEAALCGSVDQARQNVAVAPMAAVLASLTERDDDEPMAVSNKRDAEGWDKWVAQRFPQVPDVEPPPEGAPVPAKPPKPAPSAPKRRKVPSPA